MVYFHMSKSCNMQFVEDVTNEKGEIILCVFFLVLTNNNK